MDLWGWCRVLLRGMPRESSVAGIGSFFVSDDKVGVQAKAEGMNRMDYRFNPES
jgi:hypothetical protein